MTNATEHMHQERGLGGKNTLTSIEIAIFRMHRTKVLRFHIKFPSNHVILLSRSNREIGLACRSNIIPNIKRH